MPGPYWRHAHLDPCGSALPVLIVEVLSPSTERLDREAKFAAYKTIDTFRDYLLVAQDSPSVTHYTRQSDGRWAHEDFVEMKSVIAFESIRCSLALTEVYENVTFN